MTNVNTLSSIAIHLAGPETIERWSGGEVTNPETVNPVTHQPVPGGLFCERIFGPIRDWTCACGRLKGEEHKGARCPSCGVEIAPSSIRRTRMGHIKLRLPVVHPWFRDPLCTLLGLTSEALNEVIYFRRYCVLSSEIKSLKVGQILTEEEHYELCKQYKGKLRTGTGAACIAALVESISVEARIHDLKAEIEKTSGEERRKRIEDLRLLEALRASKIRPAWMILKLLPVIPADLRPVLRLEEGPTTASELNGAYQRVIERNSRLKNLLELGSPGEMISDGGRALQEAIDALFGDEPYRLGMPSLAYEICNRQEGVLAGQRHFGKRVDYSGRSVIVAGPHLKLDECGLPREMAVELFKPFLARKLVVREQAATVAAALRQIDNSDEGIWDALEEVAHERLVLLNRAPTIHYLGIQAFKPVLTEDRAIALHPLVCLAFNADFDGDQMAVHVPITSKALEEARSLMKAGETILTESGQPIVVPVQDMVLGCTYLTKIRKGAKGEGQHFPDPAKAKKAHRLGKMDLHAEIHVPIGGKKRRTTVGRILFNEVLPETFRTVNEEMNKDKLSDLIAECYRTCGKEATIAALNRINDLGFKWATHYTASFGKDDLPDVEKAGKSFDQIEEEFISKLKQDRDGFNPLWMMVNSGARGTRDQIQRLGAYRGAMAGPKPEAVRASFKEGLSPLDYFQGTYGARLGLMDVAICVSHAGYLARSLFSLVQRAIVTERDCGSEAKARSPLTCEAEHGLCARCYGTDARTGEPVKVGTAVGAIAAYALTSATTKVAVAHGAREDSPLRRLSDLIRLSSSVVGSQQHEEVRKAMEAALAAEGEAGLYAYWADQVDAIFREQGVHIEPIHYQVILSQMLRTVEIQDPGDTDFIAGEWVSKRTLREANRILVRSGGKPATARTVLLGADEAVARAPLQGEGFLNTGGRSIGTLARLSLMGAEDRLQGLEANVLLGRLIPAGTGFAG